MPGGGLILSNDLPPAGDDYPTTAWAAGEALRAPHGLALPAGAPAGPAEIQVTLVDGVGAIVAGPVALARIELSVPARSTDRPEMEYELEADFGGAIRLIGYDLEPGERLASGQTVRLTLYWQSAAPVAQSYTVFTHLLDGQGHIWAQRDGLPLAGARPTTGWTPGEVLVDVYELTLPVGAPAGDYTLEAGLYEAGSGARLPVLGPGGLPAADRVVLAQVGVSPP